MSTQSSLTIAERLQSITQQLTELSKDIQHDPTVLGNGRTSLYEAAKVLLQTISQPMDFITNTMTGLGQFTAVRLFIEWKVFDTIPDEGSITYADLASNIGAEEELIRRFARVLVATGTLKQIGSDSISHSNGSQIFKSASPLTSLVRMGFDDHIRSLSHIVPYFNKFGLKEPAGRLNTIHAVSAGDPSITIWEHMNRDPERMKHFMISMSVMAQRLPMTGSYDFSWLLEKKNDNRTLVVDVGGGKGHALQAILTKTPGLPAEKCAVQDLEVVAQASKASAQGDLSQAQFVSADFHEEQPIKGALLYYIRRCLHDYDDIESINILRHQQEAMAEDSRLIIVESVIGNPPNALAAATDIMMSTLGGKERTVEGFEHITSKAGLKIVKVHPSEGSDVALIECAKA